MSRAASPFSRRAILAMLGIGAAAFLVLLYAIGAGWTGRDDSDGGAHAAANGINGFSGLARLLEAQGLDVSLSRGEARLDDPGLLILTPPIFTDPEKLGDVVEARRYVGPTLLILPKWFGVRASAFDALDAPDGWVVLNSAFAPDMLSGIDGFENAETQVAPRQGWRGMGLSGALPQPEQVLALSGVEDAVPLVTGEDGVLFAGFLADEGTYPVLEQAAGVPTTEDDEERDPSRWAVVVVAEPDLMNNYGMADRARAELAVALVDAAREGQDLQVVFDLTLPGLGEAENLLTLAFRPPFLAATLCLLLAALVIAWRALRRFGPPVAEAPAQALGKRQLARNGAALIERAKRLHLLGPPYAALATGRIAAALGIREADPQAREEAVARQLAARSDIAGDFTRDAESLRRARTAHDLLRAARALKTIERTLQR